ncbi:MAG: SDR family oxidoreductase [Actinomycetota bacterium]|nr:SDR family oxidoreductase [Actinomycetota bacterium]
MSLLQDRVAIVSGIGPGMGRDISLALAREGANVVLGARRDKHMKHVAEEIEALGRKSASVPTDIADESQCLALADAALSQFGRIDVLVNNAFVQPPIETIEDNSMDVWRRAFEVNVLGTVQMTKAVIPAMKEQRGGSIIFINSMSQRRIQAKFGAYAATKAALLTTVQTLARELGEYGVRVNSVVPGYIWGKSLQWFFADTAKERGVTPEDVYKEIADETCLKHIPTSEEIADAVLFFASDLSRAITGQALDVNAGHWFA